MSIFEEALRKGIDAHSRAAAARREMDAILAQASREVSSVVGFPVELAFRAASRSQREQSMGEVVAGIPAPREKITVLVARSPSGRSTELAEVELSEVGYPVELRWGNRIVYADDRSGFEQGIAELLASASAGEQIMELRARNPPAAAAPGAGSSGSAAA